MSSLYDRTWMRWKSIKLPWRRQFLVGADLSGNTFWEFRDALGSQRLRRIVRYASKNTHYADVKISSQWHQWLRHTRSAAPTMQEQQREVIRQQSMLQLAHEADQRWASLPSVLDAGKQQPVPALAIKDPGGHVPNVDKSALPGIKDATQPSVAAQHVSNHQQASSAQPSSTPQKDDPWTLSQKARAPKEVQPQTWQPGVVQRR